MAKFFGKVGYIQTMETSPGIWEEVELDEPRSYYGDILNDSRRWGSMDKMNSDFKVSNRLSILADPFAFENLNAMKWVEFMGSKWRIDSIEVAYPRIIVSLGDVYNG